MVSLVRDLRATEPGRRTELSGQHCGVAPVPYVLVSTTYFPRAAAHLDAAHQVKAAFAGAWSELLRAGLIEESVSTADDGTGQIVAVAAWPDGARDRLTDLFRACVDSIWECLDSLVIESVALLSALRRPRIAPRYFPVADSPDSFAALLEQSCLDGVPADLIALIRDSQPFRPDAADGSDFARASLKYLIDWTNRLDDGSRVGAWLTPDLPEVHVDPPARLTRLEPCEPGELADERVLARFTVDGFAPGVAVAARPNAWIDLAFPDGFAPQHSTDTLDERLTEVLEVAAFFAAAFEQTAAAIPGTKRLDPGPDRAPAWTPASLSSRDWTSTELESVRASELGLAVVRGSDRLTLIVSTPQGVFERVVANASPLPERGTSGVSAEHAIQDAAATWGLPDFVMRPLQQRKGSGVREIGDSLLITDGRGVVVQAKTREGAPRGAEKEAGWLSKQIAAAVRQANGTVRQLSATTTEMINGRGRSITVDGDRIDWVAVVVIEHPDLPAGYQVPTVDSRLPVVVLTRRDWEFLFGQLRSTRAVVDYLHRVGEPVSTLGSEPERYYELATADREAAEAPPDPAVLWYPGTHLSVPLLPAEPAGGDDDDAHAMVRIMCEDIAASPLRGQTEEDRLRMLALIDALPVAYRTDLGQMLLTALRDIHTVGADLVGWRFRTYRATTAAGVHLGFGVSSTFIKQTPDAFRSWLLLRHHDRGEYEPLADATSIGVLLTPGRTGPRDWNTTMMAITGDPQLSADELAQYRELWKTPADAAVPALNRLLATESAESASGAASVVSDPAGSPAAAADFPEQPASH